MASGPSAQRPPVCFASSSPLVQPVTPPLASNLKVKITLVFLGHFLWLAGVFLIPTPTLSQPRTERSGDNENDDLTHFDVVTIKIC